jgi:hypothetical protein
MQQTNVTAGMDGAGRKRVEAVVETLATLGCRGESVAEVAHDARNMVTALGLYCDLLEEPGVLTAPFTHYGNELRLVAAASRRLVEKLVALDTKAWTGASAPVLARVLARVLTRVLTRVLARVLARVLTRVLTRVLVRVLTRVSTLRVPSAPPRGDLP